MDTQSREKVAQTTNEEGSVEVKSTTILSVWKQSEEEQNDASLERANKNLQRYAEIAVATEGTNVHHAEEQLNAALLQAKSTQSEGHVQAIFKAKLGVKVAKSKYADAIAAYQELFGENPKIQ